MHEGKLYPMEDLECRVRKLFQMVDDPDEICDFNCFEIETMLEMYLYTITGKHYSIHEAELKVVMQKLGFSYSPRYGNGEDDFIPDWWNISNAEAKRLDCYCNPKIDSSLEWLMQENPEINQFIRGSIKRCAERIPHDSISIYVFPNGRTGFVINGPLQVLVMEYESYVYVENLTPNRTEQLSNPKFRQA